MLLYHHIDFIGDVYVEKGIGTFAYFIPMKAAKVSESCVVSFQKGPGIPGLTGCNIGSPFYSLLCSNFYETSTPPQVYLSVLLIFCWIRSAVY